MITEHQRRHYANARHNGLSARVAIERARANEKPTYGTCAVWSRRDHTWNPVSSDGLAWVESLSCAGLRFVGYADEIASLRHTGWFTDSEFQDESLRGVVVQRQASDGRPVYLAGYADPCNEGAYRLAILPRDWFEGSCDEYDDSAKREAANMADEHARIAAEHEREYQDAFRHGARCREMLTDAYAFGHKAIAKLKTAKSICGKDLAIAGISPEHRDAFVQQAIAAAQACAESWRRARKAAFREIDDAPTWDKNLRDAWREGFDT